MSDPKRLERLIGTINEQGNLKDYSAPPPIVTLEEFFEGNDIIGSICANLTDSEFEAVGGLQGIYNLLKEIRTKDEVQALLVPIYDYDVDEGWPSADSVYLICRHPPAVIERWIDVIRPSDIFDITETWAQQTPACAPGLDSGMRCYQLWWD